MKSNSSRILSILLIAHAVQGNRNGVAYTVRTGDGASIRVVTDQTEVRVGAPATAA